jgi:hypothetical protein
MNVPLKFDKLIKTVVLDTGAYKVFPIHWDNHQKPIDYSSFTRLSPPPYERLNPVLDSLIRLREIGDVTILYAPIARPFDPFEKK